MHNYKTKKRVISVWLLLLDHWDTEDCMLLPFKCSVMNKPLGCQLRSRFEKGICRGYPAGSAKIFLLKRRFLWKGLTIFPSWISKPSHLSENYKMHTGQQSLPPFIVLT